MSNDYDRDKLRAQAIQALRLNADRLSGLEEMSVDLAGVLILELDALTAQQLEGREIDIGRLGDVAKLLNSLRPSQTQTPPAPDFSEAKAGLIALANQRADAFAMREEREVDRLKALVIELRAEIERMRVAALPQAPKRVRAPDVPPAPDAPIKPKTTTELYFERGPGSYGEVAVGSFSSDWRNDR